MFESEVLITAKLNKVKQDTILKNFWKNNDRFADLFNTFLFNGEEILKPDDLTEVDTDVSSMLKFNGHAETVQKILDVVKKTAYGIDFMILGLENQSHIHYAMPLRHMIGDAFSPELALVVGAITESQELIDHALENEKKGAINMCTALEELKKEGVQEGLQKGLQEGLQKGEVKGIIQTCKLFNPDQEAALKLIMDKFSLSQETALAYIKKYW